ncbi:hypothetical protein LTR10_012766 [Elasticomyces elasticus]|nr:hypothetical protein LTR10_012766 [Elasticomyces elasticus]
MIRWKAQKDRKTQIISTLLAEVWHLDSIVSNSAEANAYLEHYEHLLRNPYLVNKEQTNLGQTHGQATKVVALARKIQPLIGERLRDVKTAICSDPPSELLKPIIENAVSNAVNFVLRLWLFVPLTLDDENATFAELMRSALPVRDSGHGAVLSLDFKAKNLIRTGGFTVRTTSYLSQHLEMDDLTIYVFRHAAIL